MFLEETPCIQDCKTENMKLLNNCFVLWFFLCFPLQAAPLLIYRLVCCYFLDISGGCFGKSKIFHFCLSGNQAAMWAEDRLARAWRLYQSRIPSASIEGSKGHVVSSMAGQVCWQQNTTVRTNNRLYVVFITIFFWECTEDCMFAFIAIQDDPETTKHLNVFQQERRKGSVVHFCYNSNCNILQPNYRGRNHIQTVTTAFIQPPSTRRMTTSAFWPLGNQSPPSAKDARSNISQKNTAQVQKKNRWSTIWTNIIETSRNTYPAHLHSRRTLENQTSLYSL